MSIPNYVIYRGRKEEVLTKYLRAGLYKIAFTISGSPADGVYPIVEIRINGEVFDIIEIESEAQQDVSLGFRITDPGSFSLELQMMNDHVDATTGEDRNVFLSRISLSQEWEHK